MVRLVAAVQKKMVMSLLPVLMTSVLLFRHLPALPPLPVRTFQRSVSAALLSLEGLRHRAFNSEARCSPAILVISVTSTTGYQPDEEAMRHELAAALRICVCGRAAPAATAV